MTDDRIKTAQTEIDKILVAKPEYVVNTSEFNDVRGRLSMLHNRREGGYEQGRRPSAPAPSPRQRQRTGSDPNGDGSHAKTDQDDARPPSTGRDS